MGTGPTASSCYEGHLNYVFFLLSLNYLLKLFLCSPGCQMWCVFVRSIDIIRIPPFE
ncbi:hypothetical protein BDZ91DRAFT_746847 [Kalaharituber pfeilii]|nr:hypothetical protein BDZ91DRAFT_746847 [Kalaharituber pfeilii]